MADKELEDDEIEIEIEETEESDESSEEQETEETDEPEESEKDDADSDDDSSASDKKDLSPEEREALRERRRRERKLKRDRDRRDRALAQNLIVTLQEENRKLRERQDEFEKRFSAIDSRTVEGEMQRLAKLYNEADALMQQAVADGDGEAFTRAKKISDRALAEYNKLQFQKTSSTKKEETVEKKETQQQSDNSAPILGERGKQYGISWMKKNSWYDPNGTDQDSKIVQSIDAAIFNEGYDPETKEYWDELDDRVSQYLPKYYKKKQELTKKSPPSIVGGSGREGVPASSVEKTLPKEFVQTLKAAGQWDDLPKRKAAIKYYHAQKKGA